jgi:hypothetical protein
MPRRTRSPSAVDFHETVWPRGRRIAEGRALAPRLATLEGKTVAFLWDTVFRGDEIFPLLQTALAHRFRGVSFVQWDAFGPIFGGSEQHTIADLPDRLRRFGVQAVVSAVGC